MQTDHNITLNTKLQKVAQRSRQMSSDYFKDTKINSCSYVQMRNGTAYAIPLYKKDKLSFADRAERSVFTKSVTAETYKVRSDLHLGQDNKPLESYNPISYRNRLPVADANIAARNTSQVILGDRGQRDPKMYTTVYRNVHGNFGKVDPVTHTGILSERSKYHHMQQAK